MSRVVLASRADKRINGVCTPSGLKFMAPLSRGSIRLTERRGTPFAVSLAPPPSLGSLVTFQGLRS